MRLFLILLAVPIIEIALFIEVGGLIGTWPTLGLVVATALAGSILLRRQGLAAFRDLQGRLEAGETPGRLLADGAMILFAGALLLTPGFFTDAVGLALLLPPVRDWLWRYLSARIADGTIRVATFHAHAGPRGPGGPGGPGGQTVDGTFTEVAPAEPEAEAETEAPQVSAGGRRG